MEKVEASMADEIAREVDSETAWEICKHIPLWQTSELMAGLVLNLPNSGLALSLMLSMSASKSSDCISALDD